MRSQCTFSSRLLLSLSVVLALVIVGCGSGSTSNTPTTTGPSGEDFSTAIPLLLQSHTVAGSPNVLSATVSVDGGTPTTLSVNLTTRTVSGQIDQLSAGTHTFVITYTITRANVSVNVATATTSATIAAGATTPVAFGVPRYFDDDTDGFTNLAEVEIGTNPNLASSRPASEIPRFSPKYVLSDVAGGVLVGGSSSSTSYTLTPGL
jgi:hypothetical protein